jgi:pectinesterase
MSVPAGSAAKPVVIHIKPGTYKELIYIQHEKRFFRLVGEDAAKTILTYDLHANMIGSDQKPIGTFRTPSTVVDADDVSFENLTFENSAGPVGQALAMRVDGDRVSFRRCRFLGGRTQFFLIVAGNISKIAISQVMSISSSAQPRRGSSGVTFIA